MKIKTNQTQRWGESRYYSLDHYLKVNFNRKLYKLALDGGMSCPNRDGTLDTRGCIFCSAAGSGEYAARRLSSVTEQIENAKSLIAHKVPDSPLPSYVAYFQSYSNTWVPSGHDPVSWLRDLFLPAIRHPDIAVLSIATRPDCLTAEICDLLAELNQIKPVWVELGLQSCHERTARWMRRGYPTAIFSQAVTMLHHRSIPVIAHLIIGLKDETIEDILDSVHYINQLSIDGVKFHLLHVLKGTDLATEWEQNQLHILSEEEYIHILLACLSELSPQTVVHRITGDGSADLLLAPLWSRQKKTVLNHIRHEMKAQNIWQGKYYKEESLDAK